MQWLIDLVIEAIGIPPTYIDRGDYTGSDYTQATLTFDANWHTLDLSGIIDPGATAVEIRFKAQTQAVPKKVRFRKHGTTMTFNTCSFRTQVANLANNTNLVIGVSEDGKIDFWADAGVWTGVSLVIRGWWL